MNINSQNEEFSTNLKPLLWRGLERLNPAQNEVMIEFDNAIEGNAVLEIYDFTGKLMHGITLAAGNQYISVSTKDFKPGIYMYRILLNNKVIAKDKLLIIK